MENNRIERPLATVGALIVAPDGDILLVSSKKWPDLFSLPGGKIEPGETREEACRREILEETGLKIAKLEFCIIQESIFSKEYWKKNHFIMNDFIAYLDPACLKTQVKLNDEAEDYFWISPKEALKLPLTVECRALIERFQPGILGVLGIHQYQISCIIGIEEDERQKEQTITINAKIKADLTAAISSKCLKDSIDYVLIADLCKELACENNYFLLENFASDFLEAALNRFDAVWAWINIQKPSAIKGASYAFVEMERDRKR